MRLYSYPATIAQPDGCDDYVVQFTDFPEALTGADTLAESLELATDLLDAAVRARLAHGQAVPSPRDAGPGEHAINLEPALAARVALIEAMREQKISNVALARRMGRDEKSVRLILAGKNSSLNLTLKALRAVGLRPGLAA